MLSDGEYNLLTYRLQDSVVYSPLGFREGRVIIPFL